MPSHDRPELSEKAKKIIAAASIAVSRPGTAAAIPTRQEAEALCRTGQASAV